MLNYDEAETFNMSISRTANQTLQKTFHLLTTLSKVTVDKIDS